MGKNSIVDRAFVEDFLNRCSLLGEEEVYRRIKNALERRKKLSLVRLGDGEALTLAQSKVLPVSEVAKNRFLRYAGVIVPDLKGRDALALSIKRADIVGIPLNMMPNFLPLLLRAFGAHNINPYSMSLTNACINYFLHQSGLMGKLLKDKKPRVLVVGNRSKGFAGILEKAGVKVVAAVAPVRGVRDAERVVKVCGRWSFDIALVSAGVAAVIICERLANQYNKVAVDTGHVADQIIERGSF